MDDVLVPGPNRSYQSSSSFSSSLLKVAIDERGNDHKAFWRTIKKVLPGERKAASPKISIDGTLTSDNNRIADSFNKYFTFCVTGLLDSVWTSCGCSASPTPSRHHPDFNFAEVFEAYVRSRLRGLKPGKPVGLDNIPAGLLGQCYLRSSTLKGPARSRHFLHRNCQQCT